MRHAIVTQSPEPTNLDIALTLLQFTALALAAVAIFYQVFKHGGTEENSSQGPKRWLLWSVQLMAAGAIASLFYMITNLQGGPEFELVGPGVEISILAFGIALVITGIFSFLFGIIRQEENQLWDFGE